MSEINIERRKRIIDLLENGPISFLALANKLGEPIKELTDDFEGIKNSMKLKSKNAFCKKCNFVFHEDKRYHTPSKCPKCKSEWIESQKFWIEDKNKEKNAGNIGENNENNERI
jgi:transcriptional regulator